MIGGLVLTTQFALRNFDERHGFERVGELPSALEARLVGFPENRERAAQTPVPTPKDQVIGL